MYDVVGIGFGPSNLALAVCARERDPNRTCLFLERKAAFQWHPGMLIDGARMQISFLKDLVSLRNLSSPYSFLQYTKARGRLEDFVNLGEFRPTRVEYDDYLRWVAADFADQVRYGHAVNGVSLERPTADPADAYFSVSATDLATGRPSVVRARNVVHASGGRPRLPAAVVESPAVIHSSWFLPNFPTLFADRGGSYTFVVVGGGQSGGETLEYILSRYERATAHLVIPDWGLRPTDNSPFVNEQFTSAAMDEFYAHNPAVRRTLIDELGNSNYGVVREDLIQRLYNLCYIDKVKGVQRLVIHPCSRLTEVATTPSGMLRAVWTGRFDGSVAGVECDGVVLATGFARSLQPEMYGSLLEELVIGDDGQPEVSRQHRVSMTVDIPGGLYVQGPSESHFGVGETLLSHLPFRSQEIFDDICRRLPAVPGPSGRCVPPSPAVRADRDRPYPPSPYLEADVEKMWALIEHFKFATLASAPAEDEPMVTQLPLILDRSHGPYGTLSGHMDRANPQMVALDGHRVVVLFNGPNGYMSPAEFRSDQLPTWNSMTVRAVGRVRVLQRPHEIVPILCGISQACDARVRLSPDDPRIDTLIDRIIGLQIEIEELVGRFKLSQDCDDHDRARAADALARKTERGERAFIEYVVGLPLPRTERDYTNGHAVNGSNHILTGESRE